MKTWLIALVAVLAVAGMANAQKAERYYCQETNTYADCSSIILNVCMDTGQMCKSGWKLVNISTSEEYPVNKTVTLYNSSIVLDSNNRMFFTPKFPADALTESITLELLRNTSAHGINFSNDTRLKLMVYYIIDGVEYTADATAIGGVRINTRGQEMNYTSLTYHPTVQVNEGNASKTSIRIGEKAGYERYVYGTIELLNGTLSSNITLTIRTEDSPYRLIHHSVGYDADTSTQGTSVSSIGASHSPVGTTNLAVFGGTGASSAGGGSINSNMTYRNVTMVELWDDTPHSSFRHSGYILTGISSTPSRFNFSAASAQDELAAGVITFTGVNQAVPNGTISKDYDGGANPSVTVADATDDDMIVDVVYVETTTISAGADQIVQVSQDVAAATGFRMSTQLGSFNDVMSWTIGATNGGLAAVSIKAAPPGATVNGTLNVSISQIYHNMVINATFNATDTVNLTNATISVKQNSLPIQYFNFSINGYAVGTTREFSQNLTVDCFGGCTIEVNGTARNNQSEKGVNSTTFTVLSTNRYEDTTDTNFSKGTQFHLTNVTTSGGDSNLTLNFTTLNSNYRSGQKNYSTIDGNFTSQIFNLSFNNSHINRIEWDANLPNSSNIVGSGIDAGAGDSGLFFRNGSFSSDVSSTDLVQNLAITAALNRATLLMGLETADMIGCGNDDDANDMLVCLFRNGTVLTSADLGATPYAADFTFSTTNSFTIPAGFNTSDVVAFSVLGSNGIGNASLFFRNGTYLFAPSESAPFAFVKHLNYSIPSGFKTEDIVGAMSSDLDLDTALLFRNGSYVTNSNIGGFNSSVGIVYSNGVFSYTIPSDFNLTSTTNVTIGYRVSNDTVTWSPWSDQSDSGFNLDETAQYIQYRATLDTKDRYLTPYLQNVTVLYDLGSSDAADITTPPIPSNMNCTNISTYGYIHNLTGDGVSTATCINVLANNVTIDCHGYLINYSNSSLGYGINITGFNLTIVRSCSIWQADLAVDKTNSFGVLIFRNSNNNSVYNNSIWTKGSGSIGIRLQSNASLNNIYNNTIKSDGSGNGIQLFDSTVNNSIIKNVLDISGAASSGLYLIKNDAFNLVYNNTIVTGSIGILVDGGVNNTISNNVITSTGDNGIEIRSDTFPAANFTLSENVITTTSGASSSVKVIASSLIYIVKNRITTNWKGVTIEQGSFNNYVNGNSIRSTGLSSIDLDGSNGGSYNNSIDQNNITQSQEGMSGNEVLFGGIYLSNTEYNTISNNNITADNYSIHMSVDVNNNTFYRNVITSNTAAIVINGSGQTSDQATRFNTFTNDTVVPCSTGCAASYADILVTGNATDTTFTNVSFNRSRIRFSEYSASKPVEKNNITVRWYLDINISDASGNPLGAQAVVNDTFSNNLVNQTYATDVLKATVTEFTQNGSVQWGYNQSCANNVLNTNNVTCYTPLNVSANRTGYTDFNTAYYLNDSRTLFITMAAVGGSSCTYTSGNWNVVLEDNCVISSPVTGDGSDFILTGTSGTFTANAPILGFRNYLCRIANNNNVVRWTAGGATC